MYVGCSYGLGGVELEVGVELGVEFGVDILMF